MSVLDGLKGQGIQLETVLPISAQIFCGGLGFSRPGLTVFLLFESTQHCALAFRDLHQVEEAKQWTQVRMERDFPWEKVFHAIERTASPDIELLEFHPDKLNRVIILRGEAKSIEALLAYLQDLNVKTGWNEVHLTHQEKVKHGALETISFEVKASLVTSA